LRYDLQEVERYLPPASQFLLDQPGKARPVRALHLDLVHQGGEIARQPDRVGGRGWNHHILLEADTDMMRKPRLPLLDERSEEQQPVERGHGRREVECARARLEGCGILVELT